MEALDLTGRQKLQELLRIKPYVSLYTLTYLHDYLTKLDLFFTVTKAGHNVYIPMFLKTVFKG